MSFWFCPQCGAIPGVTPCCTDQKMQPQPEAKFKLGDWVRKVSGSEWEGKIVGTYSTDLTPEGYAVESWAHKGSVQIYPVKALERAPIKPTLADELEQAKARIKQLEQSLQYESELCQQAIESRERADARIAELEKNAARYQWLRDQMRFTKENDKPARMTLELDASETHDFDFEFMSPHFEASVDRTIDAAIAKGE